MVLHGKRGPDGEGSMYKSGLRQGEPLGDYMQTSKQSFDWVHKQEETQIFLQKVSMSKKI